MGVKNRLVWLAIGFCSKYIKDAGRLQKQTAGGMAELKKRDNKTVQKKNKSILDCGEQLEWKRTSKCVMVAAAVICRLGTMVLLPKNSSACQKSCGQPTCSLSRCKNSKRTRTDAN